VGRGLKTEETLLCDAAEQIIAGARDVVLAARAGLVDAGHDGSRRDAGDVEEAERWDLEQMEYLWWRRRRHQRRRTDWRRDKADSACGAGAG
jgi:hypothetical protein